MKYIILLIVFIYTLVSTQAKAEFLGWSAGTDSINGSVDAACNEFVPLYGSPYFIDVYSLSGTDQYFRCNYPYPNGLTVLAVCEEHTESRTNLLFPRCLPNKYHPRTLGEECTTAGNPTTVCSGNKYEKKTDYQSGGKDILEFSRSYNSQGPVGNRLGWLWQHNFERHLGVQASEVFATRADGKVYEFSDNQDGTYQHASDLAIRLTKTSSRYTLTDIDLSTETYDSNGVLLSIRSRDGYIQTLHYTGGRLTSVTDSLGRSLSFTYNSDDFIASMTDPNGKVYNYNYLPIISDDRGGYLGRVLNKVTYPATGTGAAPFVSYSYGSPDTPFLTSIKDERSQIYATFTYDSDGRVLTSEHANGTFKFTFKYNPDGTRTVTSPLGEVTTYTFAEIGSFDQTLKVSQIDRAANSSVSKTSENFNYDISGYLQDVINWNQVKTSYTINAEGLEEMRREAVDTPQERVITTAWDSVLRLPTKIQEPGRTTDFTYDSSGNMLTKKETDTTTRNVPYSTNGATRTWTWTYDSLGNVLTQDGPRTDVNDITTYTYSGVGRNLATVTNALGQVTTFTSYDASGRPLAYTDANSNQVSLTYDPLGRLLTQGIGGATTTVAYDAAGLVSSVTQPDGVTLNYTWDAAQRLTAITDGNGSHVDFTLDAAGNITQQTITSQSGSLRFQANHTYDALSRLLTDVGYLSAQKTSYGYDGNGNRVSSQDARSNTTTQAFDALNRLAGVTDPLNNIATTSYDARDNVTAQTDFRNLSTGYVYNGFNQLIQIVSPEAGTTTYRLDKAGNRTSETNARSQVTNRTFDALNRVTAEVYPGSTSENVAYTYDATNGGNKGVGLLTGFTDDSGSTALTYDALGNVTQSVQVIGGKSYTTAYTYNLASKPTLITYPSGRQVQYVYSITQDKISSVNTRPNASASWGAVAGSVQREPFGPLRSYILGNGLTYTRAGNRNFWPVTIQATDGTTTPQSLALSYDNAGNITGITDAVTPARNQTFSLDPLNRLTQGTGTYGTLNYTYDTNGNRLSDNVGGTTRSYTLQTTSNRLYNLKVGSVAVRSFGYTSNGLLATDDRGSDPDLAFTWSYRSRLKQLTSGGTLAGSYRYTAQGPRASKTVGSTVTHYLYDTAGHLIAEANGATGATTREYVWIPDRVGVDLPLAQIDASGTVSYVLPDQLGTPQKLTSAAKAIVWDRTQAPFGDMGSATGSASTNVRFPGQYADAESRLNYNGFRNYDPTLGRYIAFDPIGQLGGLNPYDYASQQPTQRIDQKGKVSVDTVVAGGVIMGAGAVIMTSPPIENGIRKAARAVEDFCTGGSNTENDDEKCYEKCKHLLPSPSGDLQGSEFRKCYRECKGSL